MLTAFERGSARFILNVTCNGNTLSSNILYEGGSTSLVTDWVSLGISYGSLSISGTPNRTGIFEITLNAQTKGLGGSWGDLEDLNVKWFVIVYNNIITF